MMQFFKHFNTKYSKNIVVILTFFSLLSFSAVLLSGHAGADNQDERDWVYEARLGGLAFVETMTDEEIESMVDRLISQGVNVIEGDASLSDRMTDEEFERELAFIKRVVDIVHSKGAKVVFYYPSLEVITINGRYRDDTFAKLHPDWVQVGFDRKTKAYFVGQKEFWVGPDDESAWMCPNSPYRQWYYARVKKLSGTGLDGIWFDVPLLYEVEFSWNCACPCCREKFKKETGMEFPVRSSFTDTRFRRFVRWSHQTLADFLYGAMMAAREANPKCRAIIETVTVDHRENVHFGLDAAYFHPDLDIVWEVDTPSEDTSMYHCRWRDYATLATSYKYARGIAKGRARWAFTYGYREVDAQLVMAVALAAQINPYETRQPLMVRTVGDRYRKRMFKWIERNNDAIWKSHSTAPAAIYYSSKGRDYIDGVLAGHFYPARDAPTFPPNPMMEWRGQWDPTYFYTGEYRGWALMLIDGHIPFDILSDMQTQLNDLIPYHVIIVPWADYMSDSEHAMLMEYVRQGGTVIVTGERSGNFDEAGASRKTGLWKSISSGKSRTVEELKIGQGRIILWRQRPGRHFNTYQERSIRDKAFRFLEQAGVTPYVEGELPVEVQSYSDDANEFIHIVNFNSIGYYPKKPTVLDVPVSLPWVSDRPVKGVWMTSPEKPENTPLKYTTENGRLRFIAPVYLNALVIVKGGK